MRAREYADNFNKTIAPFHDTEQMNKMATTMSFSEMLAIPKGAIRDVIDGMLGEFIDLANKRELKTIPGLYACWLETEIKWLTFLDMVEDKSFPFREENLRNTLRKLYPELEGEITLYELQKSLHDSTKDFALGVVRREKTKRSKRH